MSFDHTLRVSSSEATRGAAVSAPRAAAPLVPGGGEVEAAEEVARIAPGEVRWLSPSGEGIRSRE